MKPYSDLLDQAIKTKIDVKEERDLDKIALNAELRTLKAAIDRLAS